MKVGKTCRRIAPVLVAGALLTLTGCGGDQNTLDPASHAEHSISQLFWVMFAASCVGFGVIVLLLFTGWWNRTRPALPGGGGERAALRVVIVLGIAVPVVVLCALFFYSDLFVMNSTAAPAKGSTPITIDVVGHQWWWEVSYKGSSVVTANEIHIPTRTRVAVVASTADVIHSFWIPELNRKVDMIPGQVNRVLLVADRPGTYRGQCAEFCGLQHAHMAVVVIAQPRAAYDRWLAQNAKPAPSSAAHGRRLFFSQACADCHQIRGTDAHGRVGPDLTHVAGRATLAAGEIPNTPSRLLDWLKDPQHVKPGNKMPNLAMSDADWRSLRDYLETLR
jgi:cytochrome c oxidase subunit II